MTDTARPLRVLKFGGTSVGDAKRISKLVRIVQHESTTARCVVVVSAIAEEAEGREGQDGGEVGRVSAHVLSPLAARWACCAVRD